jgi:hypothetical protein
MQLGKHFGKIIETLVLKEADYISWLLSKRGVTGELAAARNEARRLIRIFDQKPMVEACSTDQCPNLATRLSAYVGNMRVLAWCDACDPASFGASSKRLTMIRTYFEAIDHAMLSGGRRTAIRAIIKSLAQAKGLPSRVGEAEAEGFFAVESINGQRRY